MKANRGYATVSIPTALMDQVRFGVKKGKLKSMGFTSPSQAIFAAIRTFLESKGVKK